MHIEEQVKKDWYVMLGNREIRGLDTPFWKKYEQKVSSKAILGFTLHTSEKNSLTIDWPCRFRVNNIKHDLSFKLK